MSFQFFLLYFVTWLLVALTPGPAVLCSMAQATRYGLRSSLMGISGIQLGNFLFFVCVALGLGTLLATATTAFAVLRGAGAVYLFYLGARIIISTLGKPTSKKQTLPVSVKTYRSLFVQGLFVQTTNPKALLFVSALLPQFIESNRSFLPQIIILVTTTIAVDFVVLSTYAFLAQRGIQSFRMSRLSIWLERVFGAALVFFGFRLLFSRK
jgi:homoserine/homoserine lactone efflux protein